MSIAIYQPAPPSSSAAHASYFLSLLRTKHQPLSTTLIPYQAANGIALGIIPAANGDTASLPDRSNR